MSTLQSPAPGRDSKAPTEAPTAEETLAAHAKRALLTRVRARITAVLDANIALLQGLRKRVGGAPAVPEEEDSKSRSRNERPRERPGSAAPPAEAAAPKPKPKRRLRAFLFYLVLMLASGLGGGALAYTQLFQKQLDRQLEASRKLEAALAKKTQPSAEAMKLFEAELARRDAMEKKFMSVFAEFSESTDTSYTTLKNLLGQQFAESQRVEAAMAENTRLTVEARQALAQAQAARAEAETRLAASLEENTRSAAEQQRQLDAAERQLSRLVASEGRRSRRASLRDAQQEEPPEAQLEEPVSRRRAERERPRPPKSGNCNLDTKNVDSLKGCLDEFNG